MDEQEKFARDVITRLARIEAWAAAAKEAATLNNEASLHRHNNLKQMMEGLATKKDVSDLEERVDMLEDDKKWLVRSIVGAWIAGTGVVATIFTKKFGG
jgi:hypothetical protein